MVKSFWEIFLIGVSTLAILISCFAVLLIYIEKNHKDNTIIIILFVLVFSAIFLLWVFWIVLYIFGYFLKML